MKKTAEKDIVKESLPLPKEEKVKLSITTEVIKKLKESNISINQLFVLVAINAEKYSLLDEYDSKSTRKEVLVYDYQYLLIHGYINTSEKYLYTITETGKKLVEDVVSLSEDEEDIIAESVIFKLCQDYLNIFPEVDLPSGKKARQNILEIEKKMNTWIKKFRPVFKKEYGIKLEKEDILTVTKNYVDRYASKGYKFMVTSSYFIDKSGMSLLADEMIAFKKGLNTIKVEIKKTNITSM